MAKGHCFKRFYCSSILAALIVTAGSYAQRRQNTTQTSTAKPKPGVVSGRAFAITAGGDVKPARMAKVYLLYLYRSVKVAEANKEEQNSAGMAWLKERLRASTELNAALERSGTSWSDSAVCRKELLGYDKAVSETLKWAEEQTKTDQFLFADADEEGNFKITVLYPGIYTLLVRGRAGLNEAFWIGDHVTVEFGTETTVKLSAPAKACLVLE